VRAAPSGPEQEGGPKVAASLRVTLRQAVYLAAAQSFAREIRLLPRAAGDRATTPGGLAYTEGL
jgi:pilus assembly protein CpaB